MMQDTDRWIGTAAAVMWMPNQFTVMIYPSIHVLTLTFMAVRFGSEKNKVGNTSSRNEFPLTG